MNISYSWLKKYIDFNLTPEELSAALTSLGLETGGIEKVEAIKGGLAGLVVGKVLTCENHPDSDHLHITTVDIGSDTPQQIVCGAPNVVAGQYVIVATLGTVLYDGDKEFVIKKAKMRGVESFGMICAEDEIGVGNSHDGIIVLDKEYAPGTPAKEIFPFFEDYVLEVDLTPNRIDAASHYGVARDLYAWLLRHGKGATLTRPSDSDFKLDKTAGGIPVEVENSEAAPRYSGITIRNVKVQPSPQWLQDLLLAIGQRPINNIVDITNYILFSFCQPLHCFDLAKVRGGKIIVKNAKEGEKFVTLDGVTRTLSVADLMICNAEEPMCIAGVFGGLDSGVTEETTDIFLESAYFNPTSVRKTARRHGLSTDASFRFERGVDPNGTMYALHIAALLVKELAGGEICGPEVDLYPNPVGQYPIELNLQYVCNLIGKEIPSDLVKQILTSLEIKIVEEKENTLSLLVPTYRVDVQRSCDVVEDLLRVYGYNNVEIGSTLQSALTKKTATDSAVAMQRLISEQLTACGYNEILNNSLTAESYYVNLTTYSQINCVKLLNPLSNDLNVMRQTLLFGGLESISHNINRKSQSLAFYEFGNCYNYNPESNDAEKILAKYSESSMLGLWLTGYISKGSWVSPTVKTSVYHLKSTVEDILSRTGLQESELVVTQMAADDIYSASLKYCNRGGKQIATLGILKKSILKQFDIEQEVYYCEINWGLLTKSASKKTVLFSDLPKTQPVERDLALLVDKSVKFDDIKRVVNSAERRLLNGITLFDVYEGKNLPEGKKSYAISIKLQDAEKTLQEKDIEKTMSRIIAQIQKELGAQLR